MLLSRLTVCKSVSFIGWALEVNVHTDMGRHASGSSARSRVSLSCLLLATACLTGCFCVSPLIPGAARAVGMVGGQGGRRSASCCADATGLLRAKLALELHSEEGAQASAGPVGTSVSRGRPAELVSASS